MEPKPPLNPNGALEETYRDAGFPYAHGVRCGHCGRERVDLDHVRSCAIGRPKTVEAIQAPEVPPTHRTCPKCGSTDVVTIAYGYPGQKMEEAARRGEIVLGGCCPLPFDSECRQCGHSWTAGRRGW